MNVLAPERPIEARRGSIALSIKRLTAPAHRRAEGAVARAAPFASRAAYAAYLARLHAFYAAIEPPLHARLSPLVPDLAKRAKLPLLARDLELLGVPAAIATARCAHLPRLDSDAAALGAGYVLEGKTLGGRFLLAEARRTLDFDAGRGASFLAGYGAETGAMWRAYLGALELAVRTGGRRAAVLNGARSTFACFTAWVEPLGSPYQAA